MMVMVRMRRMMTSGTASQSHPMESTPPKGLCFFGIFQCQGPYGYHQICQTKNGRKTSNKISHTGSMTKRHSPTFKVEELQLLGNSGKLCDPTVFF